MKCKFFGLAVAVVLSLSALAQAQTWQEQGERLHYRVQYGFLKAGEAEILYRPVDEGYHIVARAWAQGMLFNLLERLSVVGVHTSEQNFAPVQYAQMQVENDFKADKTVTFDADAGTAVYQNHRGGGAKEVVTVPVMARDMLSALYALRQSVGQLEGAIPAVPVVNLHRAYTMNMRLGRVKSTKFKGEKVFLQEMIPVLTALDDSGKVKDSWRIWVTTDERRLPVWIELKSRFGTFKATLMAYGPAAMPSAAPDMLPEQGRFID